MMKSLFLLLLLQSSVLASTLVYGPTHYVKRADSPFYAGIQAGTIRLEDCEDQLFNVPFVSSPNMSISPNYRYSVDEDDGQLDGLGFGYAMARLNGPAPLIFNFTADAQGHFPRYVGLTITGSTGHDVPGAVIYEDFLGVTSAFGTSLLSNYRFDTPDPHGAFINANSSFWATFIGVYADEGISQITLQNAFRIDHLQFGYSVPEPSSCWLAGGLLVLCLRRRREITGR